MGSVIDFVPRLRARQRSVCTHEHVEVALTEAELTCADCGAEVDPWWYLRAEAGRSDDRERDRAKREASYEEWRVAAVAKIEQLGSEIQMLTDAKNKLWNERVDGQPLGSQVNLKTGRLRRRA